jgi:hypothetical protein
MHTDTTFEPRIANSCYSLPNLIELVLTYQKKMKEERSIIPDKPQFSSSS